MNKFNTGLRNIANFTKRNSKKLADFTKRNSKTIGIFTGVSLLSILPLSEGLNSLQDSSSYRGGKSMFLFQNAAYAKQPPKSEVMTDEQRNAYLDLLKKNGVTPEESWGIFDFLLNNPASTGGFIAGSLIIIGTYIRNSNKAKAGFVGEITPIYNSSLSHLEGHLFGGEGKFQTALNKAVQLEAKETVRFTDFSTPPTKANVKMATQYLKDAGITYTDADLMTTYAKSKYEDAITAKMREIRTGIVEGITNRLTKDPKFNNLTSSNQVKAFNLVKAIQEAAKTEIELRYNKPRYEYVKVDQTAFSHLGEAATSMKNDILSGIKPISNKFGFWKELKKGFSDANLKGKVGRGVVYTAGLVMFGLGGYSLLESALTDERKIFRTPSANTRNLDYSKLNDMYYVQATTPSETISEEQAALNKAQLDAVYEKNTQTTLVPFLAENLNLPWVRFNNLIQFGLGLQRDAQFNAYPDWWENKGQKGGNSWVKSDWAWYKFDEQGQSLTNQKQSYGIKMVIPPLDKGNRRKVHTYFGVQAIEPGKGTLGNEVFLPEVAFVNGTIYFGKGGELEDKKQLGTYPKGMEGKSVWVSITLVPPAESQFENGFAIVTIHQNKTKVLESEPIELKENFKQLMEGGHKSQYEIVPSIAVMQ